MKDGFLKVACATPEIKIANCKFNAKQIISLIKEAHSNGASLIVFPELAITAYTCSDLFFLNELLDNAVNELINILDKTKNLDIVCVIGMPLRVGVSIYNCAAVILKGEILGIVPKTYIPNYSEFQEARYFAKGCSYETIMINDKQIPFGTDIMFSCKSIKGFTLGVEICEDLWSPNSPSINLALCGCNIIANTSASNEIIGKSMYRRDLVKIQSSKLACAYLYANPSADESTTDMVMSAHNIISECGHILSESQLFSTGIIYADIDLQRIQVNRYRNNTFISNNESIKNIWFDLPLKDVNIERSFPKYPFVPCKDHNLSLRCEDILNIQSMGLVKRLKNTNIKNVVLGLSGGLDSTLALIVCVRAFDKLKLDKKGILAVSMPCFGTTDKTKTNAYNLAVSFGVSFEKIDITKSIEQHFKDIGHQKDNYDTTFENAQARERTQVLMDIANKKNALVVGTSDLSEIALGFSTYNGDHMSMYCVNCSVPKTLIKHIIEYTAENSEKTRAKILYDIINTPISPELLPADNETTTQKTEDIIGPYELHDFFLYYMVRFGFSKIKIIRLALIAFSDKYDETTIKTWLDVFINRFYKSQFKRSCMPDGPKVGSISLSPRTDFRIPSDSSDILY